MMKRHVLQLEKFSWKALQIHKKDCKPCMWAARNGELCEVGARFETHWKTMAHNAVLVTRVADAERLAS